MQLACPRCGNPIPGVDIDLSRGVGVCRPCGEIVALPARESAAALVPTAALPLGIYRPETFRFSERQNERGYFAEMPPNRLAALPLLFFVLFWNGFMLVWYTIAIAAHVWPMALFGLLHLGVGLHLGYKVLVELLNTKRFSIEGGRVRFTCGPLPVRGRLDVAVSDIDGFVMQSGAPTRMGSTAKGFTLIANLVGGESKHLALVLEDEAAAVFATQRMNDELAAAKARVPQLPYRG